MDRISGSIRLVVIRHAREDAACHHVGVEDGHVYDYPVHRIAMRGRAGLQCPVYWAIMDSIGVFMFQKCREAGGKLPGSVVFCFPLFACEGLSRTN
jgi:hypothetical protein